MRDERLGQGAARYRKDLADSIAQAEAELSSATALDLRGLSDDLDKRTFDDGPAKTNVRDERRLRQPPDSAA
ncbi:hypothetical protein ACU686_16365 [Yinghuangia aomiensis]